MLPGGVLLWSSAAQDHGRDTQRAGRFLSSKNALTTSQIRNPLIAPFILSQLLVTRMFMLRPTNRLRMWSPPRPCVSSKNGTICFITCFLAVGGD